ncbi:hypothetical protein KUTeg_013561 [Tegillarca granosa]|uniref:Uncharacterized protein n=1 Tax=Tegillarca granosa TaxID=220873 RepID=A0ABQ9EXG2_TEGGR|nr:hypothetical protein KUTeg_013561 [Tegillarca granosa]
MEENEELSESDGTETEALLQESNPLQPNSLNHDVPGNTEEHQETQNDGRSTSGQFFQLQSSGYHSNMAQVRNPVIVSSTDVPKLCVVLILNTSGNYQN